jgi:hypothetical protein
MTIGVLKPDFAQEPYRLAAVHIGQRNVKEHELIVIGLCERHPLGGRFRRRHLKLVVEIKLILEGVAEILVILNDENPACCAHAGLLRCKADMAPEPLFARPLDSVFVRRMRAARVFGSSNAR